jgi:hypothetical protein
LDLASTKKITQAIKQISIKLLGILQLAFVSLTLDAHDNGSSNWLKLGSLAQEHTNQKVPQNK